MSLSSQDLSLADDKNLVLTFVVLLFLLVDAAYRKFEKQRYITCLPSQPTVVSIAVEQMVTVEIDVARYWSTIGDTSVKVTVEFRGVRPVPHNVCMASGDGGALVRVYSDLGDERVCPTAKLTTWMTPLRPSAGAAVAPIMYDRDVLPSRDRRIYSLVLQYDFTQDEKGVITPIAPALQGVLYESAFESQLMLVFDGEKKLLGTSDAFPSSISVPKGPITIRLQVRHEDTKKLEALKDLTLWIERSLEKEIALACYESKASMMLSSDSFKKRLLRKGSCASVFLVHPGDSKIPSSCKPGDLLFGSVTYESPETTLSGDGKRPGGFPVSLIVGPKPEKPPADPETPEPEDVRTLEQKLSDSVRDLKISHLNKLTVKEKDEGQFETLCEKLEGEYPGHLPLLMTKLEYLDTHEGKNTVKRSGERLLEVIAAAEACVSLIDQDDLSRHFGRRVDTGDPDSVKVSRLCASR